MQKNSADVYVVILILVVDSLTMSIHKATMCFFSTISDQLSIRLVVVVQMFDKSYDVSKQLPIIVITIKLMEHDDIRINMTCNQNHNIFFSLTESR